MLGYSVVWSSWPGMGKKRKTERVKDTTLIGYQELAM